MKNKVVIISCYIGTLPNWINLWIASCGKNEEFDFVLYTDQIIETDVLPLNLKIVNTTLSDLQNRFSRVLGFECELSHAYKLCDYKVLYGIAFSEIVASYDFWGHCDIDMIFGRLSHFITDEILEKYDRIFEVGHLSLYRNVNKINYLYKEPYGMYDYKTVFKCQYCMGFDEHTGITRICDYKRIPVYRKVVCADIDPHYKMFVCMDEDSVYGEMSIKNDKHQIFVYEDGYTYRYYLNGNNCVERQEVSYVHFMRKKPIDAQLCLQSKSYIITHKKFIPVNRAIKRELILENDFYTTVVKKTMEYFIYFCGNGVKALRKGEFGLRLKLRIGRVPFVNKVITKMRL